MGKNGKLIFIVAAVTNGLVRRTSRLCDGIKAGKPTTRTVGQFYVTLKYLK